MNTTQFQEKILFPMSGLAMLLINIMGLFGSLALIFFSGNADNAATAGSLVFLGIVMICVFSVNFAGLKAVSPNEALVLTLFGNYHGTINRAGYFYVNPFCSAYNPTKADATVTTTNTALGVVTKTAAPDANNNSDKTSGKKVSLKAITLNNRTQKVNDLEGNPIEIGAMVVWKVTSPAAAVFAVDNYLEFISMQSDSTLRNVASRYAYDHGETYDPKQLTLRGDSEEIARSLQNELQKKVLIAGIEVIEVKITHLAYASEIAAAMLQRQQASAILAARRLIVEGAVGMVQQALAKLDDENIVELDDERKATMISNLLVVLCANKEAQPVVNSGSIY